MKSVFKSRQGNTCLLYSYLEWSAKRRYFLWQRAMFFIVGRFAGRMWQNNSKWCT